MSICVVIISKQDNKHNMNPGLVDRRDLQAINKVIDTIHTIHIVPGNVT